MTNRVAGLQPIAEPGMSHIFVAGFEIGEGTTSNRSRHRRGIGMGRVSTSAGSRRLFRQKNPLHGLGFRMWSRIMKRSGTYYKLFYHFIWATRDRLPLITPALEPIVFSHLRAKCIENSYKLHAINGIADHVHLLIELKPTQLVADVAKNLKGSSAHFINKESTLPDTLYWQDGYGVVTLREGEVSAVIAYIQCQKEDHLKGKLSDVLEISNEA